MLPPASERATLELIIGEPIAKQIRDVLAAYFKLSQSLADDKLDDVPATLTALSVATKSLVQIATDAAAGDLARDANGFHELVAGLSTEAPKDAVDARTRFGRISHELTKLWRHTAARRCSEKTSISSSVAWPRSAMNAGSGGAQRFTTHTWAKRCSRAGKSSMFWNRNELSPHFHAEGESNGQSAKCFEFGCCCRLLS